MSIKVENLYEHPDGGFYCLLSDNTPMKHPDSGDWLPGVTYMGTDGVMRSTTRKRWDERFTPVAEYAGDDEQVIMMVRRANPGDMDFDFLRVFEAWHESEMGITGHMLELAVAAVMDKTIPHLRPENGGSSISLTIMTEDLQRVSTSYEIERVPIPHGFTFRLQKVR